MHIHSEWNIRDWVFGVLRLYRKLSGFGKACRCTYCVDLHIYRLTLKETWGETERKYKKKENQ